MTNLQVFISLSVVIVVTFIWFGCSLALIENNLRHIEIELENINQKVLLAIVKIDKEKTNE
ncbi:MAG: hypothetical protein MJ126_05535 [Lachnospiraceae bacterium]|nr:hypothetical protein [Lachnospiraceae bacterium]